MDAFPAFLPLTGARVAIVGSGEAADAKARLFEGSPAEVLRLNADQGARTDAYGGARLAFIALPEPAAAVAARAARAAGVLVNVVDHPRLCDFHTPAIVDRGAVVGAIGTAGSAPLLASRLRTEWEARWPEGLGRLAELLAAMRGPVRERVGDLRARRSVLLALLDGPAGDAALAGDVERAWTLANQALEQPPEVRGRVVRLTAPADPEDLTIRDLRSLARADRLVADPAVSGAVLAHARRDAARSACATVAELGAWTGAGELVVVVTAPQPREPIVR